MTVFHILLVILFAGLAMAAFVYWETCWVEVNRYRVPVGPGKLDKPVNIVHITDIHISPWYPPSQFQKAAEVINGLNPDYVVITGDIVTHFREYIPGAARALSGLKPKKGMVGVLGNHDYWIDAEYIAGCLQEAGVELLLNRAISSKNGSPITFLGVDDPYTGHDDLPRSCEDIPADQVKILLSHSPDIIEQAAPKKIDLVFAGHTHGGQVRLPVVGALTIPSKFGKKYDKGWFVENKTRMYVNRGLGGIFPPIRFLCRREIALFSLVDGEGKPGLLGKELIKM